MRISFNWWSFLTAATLSLVSFAAQAEEISPEAQAEMARLVANSTMAAGACDGMNVTFEDGILICDQSFKVTLEREKWDEKDKSRLPTPDTAQPVQVAALGGDGGSVSDATVEDVLTPTAEDVAALAVETEAEQVMPVPTQAPERAKQTVAAAAPKKVKQRLSRNQCLDLAHLRGASNSELKAKGCAIPKRAVVTAKPQELCEATVTTGLFKKTTTTYQVPCTR